MGRWQVAVALGLALAGCSERPVLRTGEGCALNSDCESPLVCRLERCRRECASNRDCDIGSSCVFDEDGLGSCTVESEGTCTLTSECPEPLVCRFGRCTNECEADDDCPAGSACETRDGERGCFDPAEEDCTLHSDCAETQMCAVDGRCREQCREDRDCRGDERCTGEPGERVCVSPMSDAGVDAGP